MSKYYPIPIKIISILTLAAFMLAQAAPSCAQETGASHIRTQQPSGNGVGAEVAAKLIGESLQVYQNLYEIFVDFLNFYPQKAPFPKMLVERDTPENQKDYINFFINQGQVPSTIRARAQATLDSLPDKTTPLAAACREIVASAAARGAGDAGVVKANTPAGEAALDDFARRLTDGKYGLREYLLHTADRVGRYLRLRDHNDVEAKFNIGPQQLYSIFLKCLEQYRSESKFDYYFFQSVKKRCIDGIEARDREERIVVMDSFEPFEVSSAFIANNEVPLPRQAIIRQFLDVVFTGINDLKNKEALVMYALDDLGYPEIAQILGIPEGTVKSRLNRAREELVRYCRSKGYDINDLHDLVPMADKLTGRRHTSIGSGAGHEDGAAPAAAAKGAGEAGILDGFQPIIVDLNVNINDAVREYLKSV